MSSNGQQQNNPAGSNKSSNNKSSADRGKSSNNNNRRPNEKRSGEASNSPGTRRNGQSSSNTTRNRQPKQFTLTPEEQEALFEKIAATERVGHCGLDFEGTPHECVICCKVSDLFAVGDCKHPVCMECAIRMRVLTDHDTCPQCRATITMMYFVQTPGEDWDAFKIPTEFVDHPDSANYNIRFESAYARNAFDHYLKHTCKLCSNGKETFSVPTFEALRQHYGQKHKQFFCHICTDNLKLFSWERKTYPSEALQMHMRRGDRDDKSFKGHPACLFCTDRFFDLEQQYKHLRKDHFFCQICDADGVNNVFYKEMTELLTHYHKTHYPCTIDECKQMGIVFRTELELNVHTASEHGDGRRIVAMDFQFSDRTLGAGYRARSNHVRSSQNARTSPTAGPPTSQPTTTQQSAEEGGTVTFSAAFPPMPETVIVPSAQNSSRPAPTPYATRSFNVRTNASDFPTLGGETSNAAPVVQRPANPIISSRPKVKASQPKVRTLESEFPTLGGSSSSASVVHRSANPLIPSLAKITLSSKSSRPSSAPSKTAARSVPVIIPKVTSSNRRHLEAYDDEPSFSGRSSPPPSREAKSKISLIPASAPPQKLSGAQLRLEGPLHSTSHFPSLGGDSTAPVVANVSWGKNMKKDTKKSANSEAPKKPKKELPKPDLWPTLGETPETASGPSGSSVKSLKDMSSAFQYIASRADNSVNPVDGETSQNDGKKKRKKKNGVAVVNLKELDRFGNC